MTAPPKYQIYRYRKNLYPPVKPSEALAAFIAKDYGRIAKIKTNQGISRICMDYERGDIIRGPNGTIYLVRKDGDYDRLDG